MESPLEKSQNISPISFINHFKQGWKILVIGVILGGLIGLAISSILQPQYEAVSLFTFSFDFARTGLLTDIEEDQAMEVAGDLINSTPVFQSVLSNAEESGIKIVPDDIRTRFVAERRFDQWLLKVRWNNPEIAAQLANLWSETSRDALMSAQQAAIKTNSLHRYILSLESCFQQSTSGLPAQPLCQAANRLELQAEMQKTGEDMQLWQNQAKGIFPGLNFSWAQEASIPKNPIQHERGSLVLAGCLTGLIAASIISLFRLQA
jgi:uncharacterized protein involved in exopolysaccharide biosynthesis